MASVAMILAAIIPNGRVQALALSQQDAFGLMRSNMIEIDGARRAGNSTFGGASMRRTVLEMERINMGGNYTYGIESMAGPVFPHDESTDLLAQYDIPRSGSINMSLDFAEWPSQALFEPLPVNATIEDLEQSTPWKKYLETHECEMKASRFVNSGNPVFCRMDSTITWSEEHKFAYLRTHKAADISFEKYFRAQFLDARELEAGESLPDDVFLFTFVRDPFEHALAGYYHVDGRMDELESAGDLQGSYEFRTVARRAANERYELFLSALENRSLADMPEQLDPKTAATQLSGIICQTSARSINFIGHVENLEYDWRIIQHLAGIPMKLRTTAIQVFHETQEETDSVFPDMELEVNTLSQAASSSFCRIYRVDYRCLGYQPPVVCKDLRDLQASESSRIAQVE